MLKILNEVINLNDSVEINKLALIRIRRFLGNYKSNNNINQLKLESDVYYPLQWNKKIDKPDILMMTSDVNGSDYIASKIEKICNNNAKNVATYLSSIKDIPNYNHTIESAKIIKNIKDIGTIYRLRSTKLYGVSPREFMLFHNLHYCKDEDAYYIYSISINNESINKKYGNDDCVRGNIIITGFYIKEISQNKCHVTAISHVELNGNIPTIAINNLIDNDTVKILTKGIQEAEKYS